MAPLTCAPAMESCFTASAPLTARPQLSEKRTTTSTPPKPTRTRYDRVLHDHASLEHTGWSHHQKHSNNMDTSEIRTHENGEERRSNSRPSPCQTLSRIQIPSLKHTRSLRILPSTTTTATAQTGRELHLHGHDNNTLATTQARQTATKPRNLARARNTPPNRGLLLRRRNPALQQPKAGSDGEKT